MEGRSIYDEDVSMFVTDSSDSVSELGADIEIREENEGSNTSAELLANIDALGVGLLDPDDTEYDSDAVLLPDSEHEDAVAATFRRVSAEEIAAVLLNTRNEPDRISTSQINSEQSQTLDDQVGVIDNGEVVSMETNDQSSSSKPPPETVKDAAANTSSDDDGMMCTICFEPWTSSGEHRLVSLRCGHLFGKNCIARWVKSRDAKCPQCNMRARKSEIRPIYARSVKTLDTTERDWAIREYEKENMLRKKCEMDLGRRNLECDMLRQELETVKKELMTLQMQLKDARAGNKSLGKLSQRSTARAFSRIQQVDLKSNGCRIMDCSCVLGMFAISQPSTNPLFPGYGLRKISVPDGTLCEFVHVHTKPIKDIAFHKNDGIILTASLDKTIRIINFLNNSVVQTYNLDCDVWSCCWDGDDPSYFYAGVSTGSVFAYDIRMTDRYLYQLPGTMERSPVVSLQYLPKQNSAKRSKCGPLVSQLGSCHFYEKLIASQSYQPSPLPLEGRFTSLSYEPLTSHMLVSCRPSMKHPQVTHTLCALVSDTSELSCNFIHSMTGGSSQAQLTRSKLMLHPDNDSTVLICAGDEESKSTLVWNGCTGLLIDKLPADSPILDVTTYRWDKPVLATLTDKTVYFYNWNNF